MNQLHYNDLNFKNILQDFDLRYVDPCAGSDQLESLNLTASAFENQWLTDYGRFHRFVSPFWFFQPETVEELVQCLDRCDENSIPVSCRGAGHSMNGSSFPTPGGILISTIKLNQVQLSDSEYVTTESGVQVLELDHWLRQSGYQLPVVHDGGLSGPTVGGFISAGGFGCSSDQRGGFWNHIREIKFWQKGLGVSTVSPDDELFYKICGSGKPNGFILSAKLDIDCIKPVSNLSFPLTKRLSFQYVEHPRLIWFTLISPLKQQLMLRRSLTSLHIDFSDYWQALDPYQYVIKYLGKTTPSGFHDLKSDDLVAAGVWGKADSVSDQNLSSMIQKINSTASLHKNISRYWQSEL